MRAAPAAGLPLVAALVLEAARLDGPPMVFDALGARSFRRAVNARVARLYPGLPPLTRGDIRRAADDLARRGLLPEMGVRA